VYAGFVGLARKSSEEKPNEMFDKKIKKVESTCGN
jgi:hypothetical protein